MQASLSFLYAEERAAQTLLAKFETTTPLTGCLTVLTSRALLRPIIIIIIIVEAHYDAR
jgi:hypothetical protein